MTQYKAKKYHGEWDIKLSNTDLEELSEFITKQGCKLDTLAVELNGKQYDLELSHTSIDLHKVVPHPFTKGKMFTSTRDFVSLEEK